MPTTLLNVAEGKTLEVSFAPCRLLCVQREILEGSLGLIVI